MEWSVVDDVFKTQLLLPMPEKQDAMQIIPDRRRTIEEQKVFGIILIVIDLVEDIPFAFGYYKHALSAQSSFYFPVTLIFRC